MQVPAPVDGSQVGQAVIHEERDADHPRTLERKASRRPMADAGEAVDGTRIRTLISLLTRRRSACHESPDQARELRPELGVCESAIGRKSLVRQRDGQLRFDNVRSDRF